MIATEVTESTEMGVGDGKGISVLPARPLGVAGTQLRRS